MAFFSNTASTRLQEENERLRERLNHSEKTINEMSNDVQNLPIEVQHKQEAYDDLKRQKNEEIKELKEKNNECHSRINYLQDKLEASVSSQNELVSEKNEMQKNLMVELSKNLSQLTTNDTEVMKKLAAEQAINQTLMAKINNMKKNIATSNKAREGLKNNFNKLRENVAHYAEEVAEKEKDLPQLGQNNMEEIHAQKFITFVIDNTKQLKMLVPDGLNMSSQPPITIGDEVDCMICHTQPRFAKCTTENCGGTFHEKCILNQFKTKRECPCCHRDSIEFENENNE